MLFGVFTIGIGTALRRSERRNPMKTKTNVKAGTGMGNVAAKWGVVQGAAA